MPNGGIKSAKCAESLLVRTSLQIRKEGMLLRAMRRPTARVAHRELDELKGSHAGRGFCIAAAPFLKSGIPQPVPCSACRNVSNCERTRAANESRQGGQLLFHIPVPTRICGSWSVATALQKRTLHDDTGRAANHNDSRLTSGCCRYREAPDDGSPKSTTG